MRRHPQRDCVLVRIAACQLGLRAFILLGLVRYTVEFWAEQTPVWPRLPAWLGDSINMSSHKTLVRVSLNVCVRRMSVHVGRVTPCLRSRVQSISSLPFSPPY